MTIQGSTLFGGGTKAGAVNLGGVAATVQPESNDADGVTPSQRRPPEDLFAAGRCGVFNWGLGGEITVLNAFACSAVQCRQMMGRGGVHV